MQIALAARWRPVALGVFVVAAAMTAGLAALALLQRNDAPQAPPPASAALPVGYVDHGLHYHTSALEAALHVHADPAVARFAGTSEEVDFPYTESTYDVEEITVDGRMVSLVSVVPKDSILAIFDPTLIAAAQAPEQFNDADMVLGVSVNGEHRAYGVAFLSSIEVVNDVVGGRPIAVTWCPLCSTGIAYAREIDGRILTFGVSGKLLMNSLVMYDRETDSLWSQFLGVAISGPLSGTALEPMGLTITEWSTWRDLHPDTLVLGQHGLRFTDPYEQYYQSGTPGVVGRREPDARLGTKELVVGLKLESAQKAYPFRYLSETPVVNDRVGGTDVLVVFDARSASGVVFDRRAGERTLLFERAEGGASGTVAPIVDVQTGTLWEGLTGEALRGPLAGQRLVRLPSTHVFWFAWADFHPDTELYTP